jgi:hypothetical protein
MGIRNNNIELEYQSWFIPATSFTGVGLIDGAQDSEEIISAGNNNPALAEVGSKGLVGLGCGNLDQVKHLIAFPHYIDTDSDVYVRCHWTSASTDDTHTMTSIVTYRQTADGDEIGDGTADALDVTIPADAVDGTAYAYQSTSAGTIYAGGLSAEQHDALELIVAFNLSGVTEVFFLGLEVFYLPKLTPGAQKAKVALPAKVVVAE